MPRGVRRPIDDQIIDIDNQIASLQARRKELIATQEQEAIKELLEAAKALGKTPAELASILSKNNVS